jgi:hypothetical protein
VNDGLLYASRSFAFVHNQMLAGSLLVFTPALVAGLLLHQGLFGVWLAKALLNASRLSTGTWLILAEFLR